MSGSTTAAEMPFNDQQLAKIRQMLIDEGLYDYTTKGVIDTVATGQAVVGEFTLIYNYIYSIIENSPQVNEETKFWFSQAGAINVDYVQALADDYIRGVTQYGLEYRGLLNGILQSDINFQLQRTSNLIGEGVINQILADGGTARDSTKAEVLSKAIAMYLVAVDGKQRGLRIGLAREDQALETEFVGL
jgi:hypothetical protein